MRPRGDVPRISLPKVQALGQAEGYAGRETENESSGPMMKVFAIDEEPPAGIPTVVLKEDD